ncbi:MAG: murein biosynthesis integral membrane protein MurJ [Bacillota bacterium]|nr:murein biosynthesis integral membrane protein MurJ [Bacillota bacterium]
MSNRTDLLVGASVGVAAGSVLSKVLGFVREIVIAARFGAGADVDAYVVASTVPSVLFGAVGAALGTVIVPTFTRKRVSTGSAEAFHTAAAIWNAVGVGALVAVAAGELLMPWIIRLLAPGFAASSWEQATFLGRIIMPMALFSTLGLLLKGLLNSLQVFALPALADPLQNVIVILSVLLLGHKIGISGLAIGTVLGATAPVWLLMPSLMHRGFRPALNTRVNTPELRETLLLALPMIASSGIGTIGVFVERGLASGLQEGSLAAINYANRLYALPAVLLGVTLSTVLFPTLAEFAASRQFDRMVAALKRGLAAGSLVLFPVAAGMLVLAEPLTRLTYERGAFGAEATALTTGILCMYVTGMPAFAWRDVTARAFYATGNTTTPLVGSVMVVGVNVVLNLVLVRILGARGLALSAAISTWAGALGLFWLWGRNRDRGRVALVDRRFLVEIGKVIFATAVMSGVVWLFWRLVATPALAAGTVGSSRTSLRATFAVLIWFVGAVAAGAISYAALAYALRISELKLLSDAVRRGLSRMIARLAPERRA